ncbi:hypothetical protein L6452_06643 [Arctium lappa]|uniref:Uncharacterized protein n=1 Tax=Arctium lappa TaxID=4217 RepID=A0ACB9EK05_ARCLA|nr:hypothetical protein L6452_06643 [Arctium lappa]
MFYLFGINGIFIKPRLASFTWLILLYNNIIPNHSPLFTSLRKYKHTHTHRVETAGVERGGRGVIYSTLLRRN